MKGKFILILALSITFNLIVQGQNGFIKGYVITNGNDTVYGEVKDRSKVPHILFSKVKFKPGNGGRKLTLSPKQIKGYAKGSESFESISCNDNDIFFAKVIHRGFLTLYKDEQDGDYGGTYLLKKEGNPCVTEVSADGTKNQMLGYFNDCYFVQDKINGEEVSNDQIVELVNMYNQHCNSK